MNIQLTLQEKELLHTVAKDKCRELQFKISGRRLPPGTGAYKRCQNELKIWEALTAKFDSDHQKNDNTNSTTKRFGQAQAGT